MSFSPYIPRQRKLCGDCQAEISAGIIKAHTQRLGVFYAGDPICDTCCTRRRIAAWADYETEEEGKTYGE